jgi:hypothetical protein
MKYLFSFFLCIQFVSCLSTEQAAYNRNIDFTPNNNYESFKFWHELDIYRLQNNIAQINFAVIGDGYPLSALKDNPQIRVIYDSIRTEISQKNKSFEEFKQAYDDTTAGAKIQLYKSLQADSSDSVFLSGIKGSSYYELYEDLLERIRYCLLHSDFYDSQENFETYLNTRTYHCLNSSELENIFGDEPLSLSKITDNARSRMLALGVNILIIFKTEYGVAYSERAGAHVGSEKIYLQLVPLDSGTILSTAELIHFWGD